MTQEENMTQEQFTTELAQKLSEIFEGIAEVIVNEDIVKTNEKTTGITVQFQDSEFSPVIYPEKIYEDLTYGETVEIVAEREAERIMHAKVDAPLLSAIDLSKEGAEKNSFVVAINAEMNKELLEETPHMYITPDLVLIPRYRVSEDASFLIKEKQCANFQMTPDELMETALKNTEERGFTVQGIETVLMEIMSGKGMPADVLDEVIADVPKSAMYVVTNDSKCFGAAAIASAKAMEQVQNIIQEDGFYILPSSIHEILAVPLSMAPSEAELRDMVVEVNATQVSRSEKLSDNIYFYNAKTKRVSLVDTTKLEKPKAIAETVLKNHAKVK